MSIKTMKRNRIIDEQEDSSEFIPNPASFDYDFNPYNPDNDFVTQRSLPGKNGAIPSPLPSSDWFVTDERWIRYLRHALHSWDSNTFFSAERISAEVMNPRFTNETELRENIVNPVNGFGEKQDYRVYMRRLFLEYFRKECGKKGLELQSTIQKAQLALQDKYPLVTDQHLFSQFFYNRLIAIFSTPFLLGTTSLFVQEVFVYRQIFMEDLEFYHQVYKLLVTDVKLEDEEELTEEEIRRRVLELEKYKPRPNRHRYPDIVTNYVELAVEKRKTQFFPANTQLCSYIPHSTSQSPPEHHWCLLENQTSLEQKLLQPWAKWITVILENEEPVQKLAVSTESFKNWKHLYSTCFPTCMDLVNRLLLEFLNLQDLRLNLKNKVLKQSARLAYLLTFRIPSFKPKLHDFFVSDKITGTAGRITMKVDIKAPEASFHAVSDLHQQVFINRLFDGIIRRNLQPLCRQNINLLKYNFAWLCNVLPVYCEETREIKKGHSQYANLVNQQNQKIISEARDWGEEASSQFVVEYDDMPGKFVLPAMLMLYLAIAHMYDHGMGMAVPDTVRGLFTTEKQLGSLFTGKWTSTTPPIKMEIDDADADLLNNIYSSPLPPRHHHNSIEENRKPLQQPTFDFFQSVKSYLDEKSWKEFVEATGEILQFDSKEEDKTQVDATFTGFRFRSHKCINPLMIFCLLSSDMWNCMYSAEDYLSRVVTSLEGSGQVAEEYTSFMAKYGFSTSQNHQFKSPMRQLDNSPRPSGWMPATFNTKTEKTTTSSSSTQVARHLRPMKLGSFQQGPLALDEFSETPLVGQIHANRLPPRSIEPSDHSFINSPVPKTRGPATNENTTTMPYFGFEITAVSECKSVKRKILFLFDGRKQTDSILYHSGRWLLFFLGDARHPMYEESNLIVPADVTKLAKSDCIKWYKPREEFLKLNPLHAFRCSKFNSLLSIWFQIMSLWHVQYPKMQFRVAKRLEPFNLKEDVVHTVDNKMEDELPPVNTVNNNQEPVLNMFSVKEEQPQPHQIESVYYPPQQPLTFHITPQAQNGQLIMRTPQNSSSPPQQQVIYTPSHAVPMPAIIFPSYMIMNPINGQPIFVPMTQQQQQHNFMLQPQQTQQPSQPNTPQQTQRNLLPSLTNSPLLLSMNNSPVYAPSHYNDLFASCENQMNQPMVLDIPNL